MIRSIFPILMFFMVFCFQTISAEAQEGEMQQEQGSLSFLINECKVIGQQLHIRFSVADGKSDKTLEILGMKGRIIDSEGNITKMKTIEFGTKKGTTISSLKEKAAKDIPVNGLMIFEGNVKDLDKIALFEVPIRSKEDKETYNFQFRDLNVDKQDLSVWDAWFEIDDGLMCKIKNVETVGNKIVVDLLFKNIKKDSKYNLHFRNHRIIDSEGNEYKSAGGTLGDKKVTSISGIKTDLVKDIPIKGSVEFDTQGTAVEEISLLELHLTHGNNFQLKGIVIK
jgi:uncharacterized Zn ribbon protein